MCSKGVKGPLELHPLPDVQHVLDSDDDLMSSPECLLSMQPVEDDYSSDDEARKKERMLSSTSINSSECQLWKVKYFLNFCYEGYTSSKEMLGISVKDLLQECLKFYYRDSLPDFYKDISGLQNNAGWENISSCLYEKFVSSCVGSKWLTQMFCLDYCNAKDEDIYKQAEDIMERSFLAEYMEDQDMQRAYTYANRMNHLLKYLRDDEKEICANGTKSTEDGGYEGSEKCDKIRGVLCEIMAYMNIDVLYNGECKLDFPSRVKDRADDVDFQVKPDVTAVIRYPWGGGCPLPYLVCEVFGTSLVCAVEKIRKCSRTSSQSDSQNLCDKNKETQINDENVCKQISHKPGLLHTNDENDRGQKPAGVMSSGQAAMQLNEERAPNETLKGHRRSIYTDEKLRNKLFEEVTFCGPEACSETPAADKLYGQLALRLYGSMQLKKRAMKAQCFDIPTHDNVFGFFVMNQLIYLVKMSRELVSGSDRKNKFLIGEDEITVSYATNIWFTLSKPNDRMALLCFLFHLNQMERNRMHRKLSKWFQDSHQGMTAKEYFSPKKTTT